MLESFFENGHEIYKKTYGKKIVGIYLYHIPILLINDPEITRSIMVKQFDSFRNHTKFFLDFRDPIIDKNVFSIKDERWNKVRNYLTPAFTGLKMRYMYDIVFEVGEQLSNHLNKLLEKNYPQEIVMKELFAKFSCDVTCSNVFGVSTNSFEDPNNAFMVNANIISKMDQWKKFLGEIPFVSLFIDTHIIDKNGINFFINFFCKILKERREKNIVRPDMMNLLLEAQKTSIEKSSKDPNEIELTDEDLAAQAFVFFFVGFETGSTAMSLLFYELALNPDVQDKLYEEIKNVSDDNRITYEQLASLKYLDMCISENLRKYPFVGLLDRECSKSIEINVDGQNYLIENGTSIFFNIIGLHYDPKYWPNPEKFDPERFDEANLKNLNMNAYLPFGNGPRMCIGRRFAIMQLKIGAYNVLKNFEVSPSKNTEIPLKLQKTVNTALKSSFMNFKRRNSTK